jgi:hypothetical protein
MKAAIAFQLYVTLPLLVCIGLSITVDPASPVYWALGMLWGVGTIELDARLDLT